MSSSALPILTELRPRKELLGTDDQLSFLRGLFETGQRAVILEGPPGTGKTLLAEELASNLSWDIAKKRPEQCRLTSLFPDFLVRQYTDEEIKEQLKSFEKGIFIWDLIVLHSSYQYEDLVRGLRMGVAKSANEFSVVEGILGFACRVIAQAQTSSLSGMIILDEINRAPIGRILGELLYAMDRRDSHVATPYALQIGDRTSTTLSFPKDLAVVGTMNSTDRSASGFDYALRRRFDFVALRPDRKVLEQFWQETPVAQLVLGLFDAVTRLVDEATSMEVLAKSDLLVGHGYFIPSRQWFRTHKSNTDALKDWIARTLTLRVYTLLRDYQEQGLLRFPETTASYKGLPGLSGECLTGAVPIPTFSVVRAGLNTSETS